MEMLSHHYWPNEIQLLVVHHTHNLKDCHNEFCHVHHSRYYLLSIARLSEGDNSFLYADTENVMLIALARLGKKFLVP